MESDEDMRAAQEALEEAQAGVEGLPAEECVPTICITGMEGVSPQLLRLAAEGQIKLSGGKQA